MVPKRASRSKIFDEFSSGEQERYFSVKDKCVCSHIDTLYFFVKIRNDTNDTEDAGMLELLGELADLKEKKKSSYAMMLDFHGLSVEATGFSIYEYRLSLDEMFDVFISSYIPNDNTPRIVVQLRTRALVLHGPYKAVRGAMQYVREILSTYDLEVGIIGINRVDYAYHTNIIQNPFEYFSDKNLKKNLCSSLRKYMKVGTVGDDLTLETLSLGNRKSNNIFFRCYDKTCEVIEKAYKSFFIEKWRKDGLISAYDYFVLMYAYETGSYVAGIHVGRMLWYIKYGHDEKLKEKFRGLIDKYRQRSDNNRALKKQLDEYRETRLVFKNTEEIDSEVEKEIEGLLPKVTRIMNIEFQTKRKLYCEFSGVIGEVGKAFEVPDDEDLDDIIVKVSDGKKKKLVCEPELRDVFAVIAMRSQIQKYLVTKTVCWVNDRKAPADEKKVLDWWSRIQSCKIESDCDYQSLIRCRDLNSDIKKTERRLKNTIAHLQIIRNLSTEAKTFHEDVSDVLCYLNDNDFYGFGNNLNGGRTILKQKDYGEIRERKARQDKGLIRSIEHKKTVNALNLQKVKESDKGNDETDEESTGN